MPSLIAGDVAQACLNVSDPAKTKTSVKQVIINNTTTVSTSHENQAYESRASSDDSPIQRHINGDATVAASPVVQRLNTGGLENGVLEKQQHFKGDEERETLKINKKQYDPEKCELPIRQSIEINSSKVSQSVDSSGFTINSSEKVTSPNYKQRDDVIKHSSLNEGRKVSSMTANSNQSDGLLKVPSQTYRSSSPPTLSDHSLTQRNVRSSTTSSAGASISPVSRFFNKHALDTLNVPSGGLAKSHTTPTNFADAGPLSGRLSPNSPSRPRGSFGFGRKKTHSISSDAHLDHVPQDEDASRWADQIRAKRASKRKRKEEEDDDRVVVGTKVDQNHVNWVTAYNMLTGIRFTVSRTNAKLDRELTDADFVEKNKFSFDITGNELTPSAKYDFKFKDYAPWVFRHLRAIFRLDPADYLMSLTSKYILSELGSPGKSGSFFYFSRDYKYIIKTIHHGEHRFLRRILKDYYNHVQNNPNTLLSQFYGLHRVKIPYGRKIHFVVMNNLFPPHRDIHRTFDLKGSTIGRDLKEEDLIENPRATLKDLNWLRRNMRLELGPSKRQVFLSQVEKDVKLLQELEIMDYSLLLGIHDLEKGNEENLRDKTLQVFQAEGNNMSSTRNQDLLDRIPSRLDNEMKAKELRQIIKNQRPIPMDQTTDKMPEELLAERSHFYFYSDDGGFRATHEDDSPADEIYYLGVIDCLTNYNLLKRMEHFLKGLTNDETQISAVPPDYYGQRFVRFITGITRPQQRTLGNAGSDEKQTSEQKAESARPRSPTDEVMNRAMQQAKKSLEQGASEHDIPDRHIVTVRAPAEPGEVGPILAVVEESLEVSCVTGQEKSEKELQSPVSGGGPPTPPKDVPDAKHVTPPSLLNEQRPPTPPTESYYKETRSERVLTVTENVPLRTSIASN